MQDICRLICNLVYYHFVSNIHHLIWLLNIQILIRILTSMVLLIEDYTWFRCSQSYIWEDYNLRVIFLIIIDCFQHLVSCASWYIPVFMWDYVVYLHTTIMVACLKLWFKCLVGLLSLDWTKCFNFTSKAHC